MSNIREVYRAGWLKKITSNDRKKSFKNPHVEKVWMVFCVHDDRFPFLEQYKSRATSSGHLPLFAYPLTECFHISTSIRPTLEQEHEFVVTLRQDVVKFSSHRREVAVEWVSVLRGQLRQLHVLGAASNVYTRVARTPAHPSHMPPTPTTNNNNTAAQPPPSLLTGQRDPTSPLPAPPPQQQQQNNNNNNNNDTTDCTALNSNVSGDLTDCYIAENAYSVSPVSSSRAAILTDTPSVAPASVIGTTVAVEGQNRARLGTAAVSCVRARDPPCTNDRNAGPAATTGDVVVSSVSNKHNKTTTTTTNVLQNGQSQPGSHVTVISVGECVQLGQSHLPPSSSISSSLAAAAVAVSAVDSGSHTPSLPVLSLDGAVGRRRSDHVRASRSHHHEQQQLSADRSLSAVVLSSHSSVQRSHSLTPQHQRPTLTRLAPPSFHRQTSDCSLDSRHVTRSSTQQQQRHQTGGGVVPPSSSQQIAAVSAAATSDRRAGSSVTGAASSSVMPHQLRTETALMRGASGSSLSRDQYVAVLKREISFRPGVRITLPLNTVTTALLFSEAFGSLWLCGWKWREQPALSRALHVGDSLVSVCGVAVSTAPQLSRTLKQMHQRAVVELIIRRLPHGMVMLIKRDSESQPLGLECSSGSGEVIKVCGAASNQGLPGRCRAASGGSLCNWYISELDCRPVPLISRGDQLATRLASLTARDVCVVLLPVDLVHVLQRRLKATRHCKQFILH